MARIRDMYLPLGFDDSVCKPRVPSKMRGTSNESLAHRRLKKRLARAAVDAGWHVAYETGPYKFDVVCVDEARTRLVGLEAVTSSGGLASDYRRARDVPTFWFFHSSVSLPHERSANLIRVTATLEATVKTILTQALPWELELPSAWDLYNTHPLNGILRHPEEFFDDCDMGRFIRTVRAAIRCPENGDKIVHELLRISEYDSTRVTQYGLTREELHERLRPHTYRLRMEGAGL